ncbi:MAG: magnesium chelatase [Planctomycetota bacterium]|nr:magnesium chelatase [Planctomycetota bacterium]
MAAEKPMTRGALRAAGWQSRTVRDELRENLLRAIQTGMSAAERWPGVLGYDDTVIPQLEQAILSKHDFILLGLRGQAKTRILRQIVNFLDPEIPALDGCPLNDDPFDPISGAGHRLVAEAGDAAPLRWIPREERYREKLATPDVTIADLIGDVDPIKAASRRVTLDDEEALNFGLVPRTNRGIFAINELPDLSQRIQVGLLNILEERDVQLRGFPVRIPLDTMLVFSANPEDYTNRGSIITPLRDRIASQILTHYPTSLDTARAITDQEAYAERGGPVTVHVPSFVREAIEETAIQARDSEFVDQSSGVSVRLTIALLENVISSAERRGLLLGQERVTARIADLFGAIGAVTGKIELVFEGEREGPAAVAERILGQGVQAVFQRYCPAPYDAVKAPEGAEADDVYKSIVDWFTEGNQIVVEDQGEDDGRLLAVPELTDVARTYLGTDDRLPDGELPAACELVLEGLHQASLLSKDRSADGITYGDMLKRMFAGFED